MRERVAQLCFGSQIVDLNTVGGVSLHSVLSDAGGTFEASPQHFDLTTQGGDTQLFQESWTLAIRGRHQDDVAARVHTLVQILREAWRYTFTERQTTPVYLVVRAAGESNFRYALVHSCPKISGSSPLFSTAFEDHLTSGLFDVGLPILRYCWQDGTPGELPSLTTLTHIDGPTDAATIYVANFRDTAVLTHIYNFDNSLGAWTANLVASAGFSIWSVAASVPSQDDDLYLGSTTGPFHHVVLPIGTAGVFTADMNVEYSITALFLNNGFETAGGGGADIWANWVETAGDGALADEVVFFYSGAHACRATSGPTSNTKVEQAITVVPGAVYDISFWTRGDGVNAGRYAVYDVTNAAYIVPVTSTGVAAAVYAKVSVRVTAPAGCVSMRLDLMCPPVNAGVAYFDVVLPGGFAEAPLDTKCTLYPTGNENEIFKSVGDWVIDVGALWDWVPRAINGITAYWIRVRIEAVPAVWTVTPVTNALVWLPKTPEVRIPAIAFPSGDTFPLAMMRALTPYGGDDDEGFPNLSRIIVGLKSRNLSDFVSHLNLPNIANPVGWATAIGTDTTQVTDTVGPMGQAMNVSFATDISLITRVTVTGTAMLSAWPGTYHVFLRCQQTAGVAGECSVTCMVKLRSTAVSDPGKRLDLKPLAGVNLGLEIVDLGILTLPFAQVAGADVWTALDLIFQIQASRSLAAATLRLYDLILIPIDEWSAQYDDPLTDTTYGTSALRGNNALEVDGGIIRPRVLKDYVSAAGVFSPLETWRNGGAWPKIPPATACRLYFLMAHFPAGGTWNVGPMIGTLGQMVAFRLYGRNRYMVLRGSS